MLLVEAFYSVFTKNNRFDESIKVINTRTYLQKGLLSPNILSYKSVV